MEGPTLERLSTAPTAAAHAQRMGARGPKTHYPLWRAASHRATTGRGLAAVGDYSAFMNAQPSLAPYSQTQ